MSDQDQEIRNLKTALRIIACGASDNVVRKYALDTIGETIKEAQGDLYNSLGWGHIPVRIQLKKKYPELLLEESVYADIVARDNDPEELTVEISDIAILIQKDLARIDTGKTGDSHCFVEPYRLFSAALLKILNRLYAGKRLNKMRLISAIEPLDNFLKMACYIAPDSTPNIIDLYINCIYGVNPDYTVLEEAADSAAQKYGFSVNYFKAAIGVS